MNQWIDDEAVYRTAPATPGLLKNLFQNRMIETKQKYRYFNSHYCEYKHKSTLAHPIEECDKSCKNKNCTKRHRKLCCDGQRWRHTGKCSYKHRKSQIKKIYICEIWSRLMPAKNLGRVNLTLLASRITFHPNVIFSFWMVTINVFLYFHQLGPTGPSWS